jgi:SAM-dependent methyltransferase
MLLSADVVSLREFYASSLGECVRRDLSRAISRHWGSEAQTATSLVGLGFAPPYLRPFLSSTASVLSVMFPHMGGMYWPVDSSNHTVLAQEAELPLYDQSVQRLLLVHALEHSPHLTTLMSEVFRVLVPGGRALMVVPNRRGLWSRTTNNPFGFGHPYHSTQLRHRAELAGLSWIKMSTSLFYPPSSSRLLLKTSRWIECAGELCLPLMGGVVLVEVEKQLYASIPEPAKRLMILPQLQPYGGVSAKNCR